MTRLLKIAAIVALVIMVWLMTPGGGVPILAYHQVSSVPEVYSIDSGQFEEQMRYLAIQGYTAISFADLFAARAGTQSLPPKPVIITFDDGYDDNYLTALPVMARYGLKSTVFVIAGQVGQPGYLTWDQIKNMQSAGTEFGSHTFSHVALNEISQPQLMDELTRSKQLLEQNLARPVDFFAYPYGQYNLDTIAALKQAGYTGACTGLPGLGTTTDDAYQLKRVNIPRPKYGLWEFRLRLVRAHLYAKLSLLRDRVIW
ncbi:polysaccharide deacetylase family protein [Sporomusa sp.]|uniref:polysaccharide deacetylase family protein n=1 Tax=Sporomusa sp. TaxID=2078658 RepID=UPI002C62D4C4|nr:polysaccharide deacetylase family protein [Sporomusa sp.]HWR06929.1 polysaccharide deacetylase family protein [Sporomusa sp.]